MWLVLAAPASFLVLELALHFAAASLSHFFMKLVRAAPASFLPVASDLQDANALVAAAKAPLPK